MSTLGKTFCHAACTLIFVVVQCLAGLSQELEIQFKLSGPAPAKANISVSNLTEDNSLGKNIVFADDYADAKYLARRITNLKLYDQRGKEISYRKFKEGEFVADSVPAKIEYNIALEIPESLLSTAHISWLGKHHGLLMLDDTLPKFRRGASGNIKFDLPQEWKITGRGNDRHFRTTDLETEVFSIGADWRESGEIISQTEIRFSVAGEWNFDDSEALKMAAEIYREYERILGNPIRRAVRINLLPFPKEMGVDRWRAETRGLNIVIVSSPPAFQSLAKQRLHEQLRHELLHLWIPNELNLSGDFAWFYEGFAVYQSLKSGVWLGQLRFEDYLNTLNAALDLTNRRESHYPLLSPTVRWDDPSSSVYASGMLVAFICDISLLKASGGKRELNSVFRKLLRLHNKDSNPEDGDTAVLAVLKGFPELAPIVADYIEAGKRFDMARHLQSTGIEITGSPASVKMLPVTRLNRRQKAFLDKLGYNRWRKLLN